MGELLLHNVRIHYANIKCTVDFNGNGSVLRFIYCNSETAYFNGPYLKKRRHSKLMPCRLKLLKRQPLSEYKLAQIFVGYNLIKLLAHVSAVNGDVSGADVIRHCVKQFF